LNLHVIVLLIYSLTMMAIGLWVGRRVRGASDFFVAGRRLGPGLILATMLAANIGAGSTVGAASRAYLTGVAAWWWVGSAAVGSAILAFSVGPRIRRVAAARELRTVGDFLEFRYNGAVRATISVLLWAGSIFILASQLIAIGWILEVVAAVPKPVGSAIGGIVITVYFAAGGLLTAAWVNVVQLTIKLVGFVLAVPLALSAAGGWSHVATVQAENSQYWAFWQRDTVSYLLLLAPAFIVSPGLLQKIFGAKDDRAVRLGVGLNALGLFLFAALPVTLGIVARSEFPSLAAGDLALPTVLMHGLPLLVGAIGLAAVFSAEVSAADAVLFMLTTSLSQDLYKRFLKPAADDDQLLRVARWATLACGTLGVALAVVSGDVIATLTIFYSLLSVGLFVPIVAGLYVPRTSSLGALLAIAAGVGGMLIVQMATGGRGWGMLTPAPAGLIAACAVWLISLAIVPADSPEPEET
jgi:SSS family solute:Na+ symporter